MKCEIAIQEQKIAVLLEEIKALRKLSKIPTEDAMARKVVKMELAMQEKHSNEKRRLWSTQKG